MIMEQDVILARVVPGVAMTTQDQMNAKFSGADMLVVILTSMRTPVNARAAHSHVVFMKMMIQHETDPTIQQRTAPVGKKNWLSVSRVIPWGKTKIKMVTTLRSLRG